MCLFGSDIEEVYICRERERWMYQRGVCLECFVIDASN